jgi:hypothetical protein
MENDFLRQKIVTQKAFLKKNKNKYNQKVSFGVTSNDTF